ncbi:MAG: helix-hairpin-helix domain-containing protein [Acidobacteriota bacterium]|jgi:comEA protein
MQQRIFLSCLVVAIALSAVAGAADGQQPNGVVNINNASAEELQLLPRVGPALAGRIIEFREANGPFRSVDEIIAVKGIGERSFENLKPYIVTSGATTLSAKVKLARSTVGAGADD